MDEFTELLKKFDDTPEPPTPPPLGKVLIIDDDPNIRQGLEKTLTRRNYEVVISVTGEEGLEQFTADICVVILDVKLPRTNGITLYGQLTVPEKDRTSSLGPAPTRSRTRSTPSRITARSSSGTPTSCPGCWKF